MGYPDLAQVNIWAKFTMSPQTWQTELGVFIDEDKWEAIWKKT